MIKEEPIVVKSVKKTKICDVCGENIPFGMACSVAKCEMCGKDLCEKCVGHEESTTGDYREVWCFRCWIIGKPFRDEIADLENQIEALADEWERICKDNL